MDFTFGLYLSRLEQLDRHNDYHQLEGLYFPHHDDPRLPLKNTLIDGELVLDVDPQSRKARNSSFPPFWTTL